jgi:hypothetical protein
MTIGFGLISPSHFRPFESHAFRSARNLLSDEPTVGPISWAVKQPVEGDVSLTIKLDPEEEIDTRRENEFYLIVAEKQKSPPE